MTLNPPLMLRCGHGTDHPATGCVVCGLVRSRPAAYAALLAAGRSVVSTGGAAADRPRLCRWLGQLLTGQRQSSCNCKYECVHPDDAKQSRHPEPVPSRDCRLCPEFEARS